MKEKLNQRMDNIHDQNQKYTSLEDKIRSLNLNALPKADRILAIAQSIHYDKDGLPVTEDQARQFLKNPLVHSTCVRVDHLFHSQQSVS